ncbi:MAG: tetratricopeptide repeat protein [Akkermansiaceae bacterium]|jgi:TPR repeat protein
MKPIRLFLTILLSLLPLHAAVMLDVEDMIVPNESDNDNYRKAFEAFKKESYAVSETLAKQAISEGVPDAYFILGWLHEKGLGRPVNLASALDYYRKGHQHGFDMTSLRYGILLINSTGPNQEKLRQQGLKILVRLNGDPAPTAQLIIAKGHALGQFASEPDFDIAMAHLNRSIQDGNQEAVLFKAALLEGQHNYPKPDPQASISLYETSAEQGNPKAILSAGLRRLNGPEAIRDPQKGLAWLYQLVEKNDPEAHYQLAFYDANTLQDFPKAVEHLIQATQGDHPKAHLLLGILYQQGKGTDPSETKAIEHLEKATSLGEPQAAHQLARLYMGRANEADSQLNLLKGYHFLTQASTDLPAAQTELGLLYLSGKLGAKDSTAAAAWFTKAATAGLPLAQFNLAALYELGNGVTRNPQSAHSLYSLAAKQGILPAITSLGRLTAIGLGTDQDPALAWAYLTLASDQKEKDAPRLLDQLTSQLTAEQLAEGKKNLTKIKSLLGDQ